MTELVNAIAPPFRIRPVQESDSGWTGPGPGARGWT